MTQPRGVKVFEMRLKIFAGHPVQYLAPLFRELTNSHLEIEVKYYHAGMAMKQTLDPEFGLSIKWDIDLLRGYLSSYFRENATYSIAEQVKLAPRIILWALRDRKTPLLLIGWFAEIVWLIWLFRVLLGAPTLTFEDNTVQSYAVFPKPKWRMKMLAWLLCHSTAHLYVGTRNREFLCSMGVSAERLYLAPHSVDNERFDRSVQQLMPVREQLCSKYGLDPHLPTFLCCGKLIPKKRPVELLDAFIDAGLKDHAQLLFVGDGVQRAELERRIKNEQLKHVHILGFLNQTEMPIAYVLGEILCLVSDSTETWGLVVNEASACGRPVIVSENVGCMPDLVSTQNGWIVRGVDNRQALAAIVRQAYDERDRWGSMGNVGRSIVAGHTYDAMVKGMRLALTNLTGGK